MRVHLWLLLCSLAAVVDPAVGADVYAIQGTINGRAYTPSDIVFWTTELVFFNASDSDSGITLRGISNGFLAAGSSAVSFTVPSKRSVALGERGITWIPNSGDLLFLLHLDVPIDVSVDSVLFIGGRTLEPISPSAQPFRFGKVHLPVFRSLVPAGQPQIHTGTDLGPELSSHVNVTIYNAGTDAATAVIEFHQHCDDSLLDRQTSLIAPNRLVQLPSMQPRTHNCPLPVIGGLGGTPGGLYTIITVDQPSLTLVSTVADAPPPTSPIHVSGRP